MFVPPCRITDEQRERITKAVASSKRAETERKYESQYQRYLVSGLVCEGAVFSWPVLVTS
jgi:hypothetical protein